MKKICVILAVLFALGSFKQLAAQARITYHYYPASNVYYNVSTGDYLYYNPANTGWVTVKTLPSGVTITKTPRHTVYYTGNDVWKDNGVHKSKYKIKKTTVTRPPAVTKSPAVKKSTPVKKGNKN